MNKPNIYIIACGKDDGLGSQVISKILAMIYSKKHNFEYVHHPLLKLDFRDQDESGKKAFEEGKYEIWIEKWNNLLNFDVNYKNIDRIEIDKSFDLTKLIKQKQIKADDNYLLHNFDPTERINYLIDTNPTENQNKNLLFYIKEFPKIDKYNYEEYKDILNNIRNNINIDDFILDRTKINITLHIRHSLTRDNRHNLLQDWNKNNFRELIIRINNKLKDHDLQFHIISDGTPESFPEYEFINDNLANLKNSDIKNIKMHLSTDSIESFSIMVKSQILVMGTSAFSYVAGLFNSNFVIYPEFHDKPIKDWFIFNNIDFDNLDLSEIIRNNSINENNNLILRNNDLKKTNINLNKKLYLLEKENKLLEKENKLLKNNLDTYYKNNLMKDNIFNKKYYIEGCLNENLNLFYQNNFRILSKKPYENFSNEFKSFNKNLIEFHKENKNLSYAIFDETDYNFIKNNLKNDNQSINNNFINNDYICIEVLKHNLFDKYNKLYPENIISGKGIKEIYKSDKKPIPSEFIYGIISNKFLFRNFNSIGLIGANEKLEVIRKLMEYEEYQEYLGLNKFQDYINLTQEFSFNNIKNIRKTIKGLLKKTKSTIFLVSIGEIKSEIFHLLKDYKNATYIDIGCYMDALAGIIDYKLPYAGNWINYKIQNYDYSKINNLEFQSKFEKYL